MVESMKPFMLLALGAALTASAAWAGDESLPDPTRPPAVLSAPVQGKSGAADEAAESAQPAVQAIKYSRSYKAAVIDGQEIRLGGEYRGAKLVAITPTEVVLQSGKEKQVLKLFPQVDKTNVSPAAPSDKNQIKRKKSS